MCALRGADKAVQSLGHVVTRGRRRKVSACSGNSYYRKKKEADIV
jgi:hypothetical protein